MGDGDAVEFMSERPLLIGTKYLVFLTEGDTAGLSVASTNSATWPVLEKEMQIRKLCEASYSGLKAIRDLTSEFKSGRGIKVGDDWILEPWVEANSFNLEGSNVAYYRFDADTILVSPDGVVKSAMEVDQDSHYPFVNPFVWFNLHLLKWYDYRAAIIAELAKFEASKKDSSGESR